MRDQITFYLVVGVPVLAVLIIRHYAIRDTNERDQRARDAREAWLDNPVNAYKTIIPPRYRGTGGNYGDKGWGGDGGE